ARHQIVQRLPVRADALADRARQALIGIRLVIDPLGVDERHALLLETLAARNEEVWPRDRRDGDPALGGAQAAATVAVDAGRIRPRGRCGGLAWGLHRL